MPRLPERWLALVVVAAAVLPYLGGINDYFLQDDFGVVQLLTTRGWSTFPRWFTMPWMENIWGAVPDEIRPFVAFTYQLTGKFAPSRPELHHIVNIAFHAGCALLVMALARVALGLSAPAAAIAGGMFALLPSQVESVAWITGRVDAMPAFLYLATVLAYVRWRHTGRLPHYIWALVLCFVALFSKQNAITIPATLATYDLMVLDRTRRGRLVSAASAWLPFVLLTIGYLGLRRVIFGHAVRGGVQSWQSVETFLDIANRHFLRVTVGHAGPLASWEIAGAVAVIVMIVLALWVRPQLWRAAVWGSVLWWIIGVAPVLVAGYESPRHVYLASAAWAFMLAMMVDGASRLKPAFTRIGIAISAVVLTLVIAYVARLNSTLREWESLARISQLAVSRVGQEAAAARPGTLILVSVPRKSWEWAVPFVLQPPYQTADLSTRVRLLAPWRLYCCGPELWGDYARRQLRAWLEAPDRPPAIALRFEPGSGKIFRATDSEIPELRELVPVLLQIDTPEALDFALIKLLDRVQSPSP